MDLNNLKKTDLVKLATEQAARLESAKTHYRSIKSELDSMKRINKELGDRISRAGRLLKVVTVKKRTSKKK